ncbi:ABC-three component system middle component 5 [Massilibacteroides vaginae]|uniref:ABC-three component system middle component 5 n=1 Tax=Massilibacteroides vaginae TaxID=1673718 RepID=UPI000A1CB33E|nr:ABC-three component system middle component 5 [Massilibacteroides vaginae]
MIVYNQAFDLYHTIFRILHFLNKFENDAVVEIERIRIWDFYLLFPHKIHDIRLKQNESDIRKIRKDFIKDSKNPYEQINENRKIFEKIKPYQLSALNCIASYGIIDKSSLNQQRITIINKNVLTEFVANFEELSPKERNIIALMTSHFYQMSLFGTDGLKNRTNLIESKYDA